MEKNKMNRNHYSWRVFGIAIFVLCLSYFVDFTLRGKPATPSDIHLVVIICLLVAIFLKKAKGKNDPQ